MPKIRRLVKESPMRPLKHNGVSKNQRNELPRPKPSVIIRASVMTQQQEQRLSAAVDALLSEWVRQEMSRSKQS